MLEIGVAERPKIGATVSGDSYLIKNGGTHALIAVIDGLGGGQPAAEAAHKAHAAIETSGDQPLKQVMQAAHQACLGTRGAVVGLLRLDWEQQNASYAGIGNIGVYVISQHVIKPIPRNGIVGYRMPNVVEHHAAFDLGDTFILFSDGISARFTDTALLRAGLAPQPLADQILATHGKANDDATVVVIQTVSVPHAQ